jgi:hypothetical protein
MTLLAEPMMASQYNLKGCVVTCLFDTITETTGALLPEVSHVKQFLNSYDRGDD